MKLLRGILTILIFFVIALVLPLVSQSGVSRAETQQTTSSDTYSIYCGLWRVDNNFNSTIRIRNELLVAPLDITPVLYMSDGTEYDLPAVHLATGGVGVVDVNEALARVPTGMANHLSQFGSAELRYEYKSPGHVVGSIQMLNVSQSLIFVAPFNGVDGEHSGHQTLEGLWWKHDPGVGGYISLANVTTGPVKVTVQAVGSRKETDDATTFEVGARATKMIDLNDFVGELHGQDKQAGGLRVTYDGPMDAVMVTGGLVNAHEGYSANLPFVFHDHDTSDPAPITYASTGIMVGAPDRMMNFPNGTQFRPYVALRNTTSHPLGISLSVNWTNVDGTASRQALPTKTLPVLGSEQLDLKSELAKAGLGNVNGDLNVSASFNGHAGDLIVASGSVDESGTYVFEVTPQGIGESHSKQAAYWTVANGFDTMYSVLNPTNKAQDLVMTFYYADGSGRYKLPVHLAPNASTMVDLMMLIESHQPDAEGHTIPSAVSAGSAIIESSEGRKTPITVVVSGGTYNVQTATCGETCITCCGYINITINPSNFYCPVGESMQCDVEGTDCNGFVASFGANWSTSDPSVMTVDGSGLVYGVGGGSATIRAQISSPIEVTQGQICGNPPNCPTGAPAPQTQATAKSKIQIALTTSSCQQSIRTGQQCTLTVQVFHDQIGSVAQSASLSVFMYSSSPPGSQVQVSPTPQSVVLPANTPAGTTNYVFSYVVTSVPPPSATVIIAGSLSGESSGLTVAAPSGTNGQVTHSVSN